jgi:hypothetical protein
MSSAPLPAGYVSVRAGRCIAVVREEHRADAESMLEEGSLYEAAARDLGAQPLAGRGVAYAVLLPTSRVRAVVRHNRHGGLLAPITRDLFLPPTRAPRELATALRLAAGGVRTPAILMYGVQRAGVLLRRSDVVTREVEGGRDLAAYMRADVPTAERAAAWSAARTLLRDLGAAGARHHDLNAKNILLAPGEQGLMAWVLDVDRVVFGEPASRAVHAGNVARLLRSARKWRDEHGAVFDEAELAAL